MKLLHIGLIILTICAFSTALYFTYQFVIEEIFTLPGLLRLSISIISFVVLLAYTLRFKIDTKLRFKHLTLLLFVFISTYALAFPTALTTYGTSFLFVTVLTCAAGLFAKSGSSGLLIQFRTVTLVLFLLAFGILIFTKLTEPIAYLIVGSLLMIGTLAVLYIQIKAFIHSRK